MPTHAVSFALTPDEAERLLAAETDEDRLDVVQEEIEEAWDEEHLYELDKSWDAIHRCLTDGTLGPGEPPLGLAVLGGKQLYEGDEYVFSFVAADELGAVVEAARKIDRADMRRRYNAMVDYEGPKGDDDFDYTWGYFQGLVDFLERAHHDGRAVLFTVDQ